MGENLPSITPKNIGDITDKIITLAEKLGECKFYPYQLGFARRIVKSILNNEGATVSALFSRQCLAEGTLILSPDGDIMPIEKHPAAWKTSDSAELLELTVYGGHKIFCTPNHPIFTPNGWTVAGDLKKNELVAILSEWNKFGSGEIPYKDSFFTMNEELAELLGLIIKGIKNKPKILFITENHRISTLLAKYFPEAAKRGKKSLGDRRSIYLLVDGRLKIFLRDIIRLDKNGFPTAINYFTREQIIAFLKPFINHSFYVIWNRKITNRIIINRPIDFHKKLRLLFLKLGIQSRIDNSKKEPSIITTGTDNLAKIKKIFGDKVFHYILNIPLATPDYTESTGEVIRYRRIHDIKPAPPGPTWDMEVPDKGWFIANGIKVSNSGKTTAVAMVTAAMILVLPILANKYEELKMYKRGFWVGIFAPINEQAVTLFDRIFDMLMTDTGKEIITGELRMPLPTRGGRQGNIIRLNNKSFIRMHSASPRAKIESKTYHLILLDEVQEITSFKISKCFAEGTEVWLPDGRIIPIEQVVKEKLDVITPDGPKTPSEWYDNGPQEVWRITTNLGKTIEVTKNHRFLVRRYIGNRQAKIDTLANIKVGDTIAAPLEVPYFGNRWSYNEGLLTGLFLGDGCFTGGSPMFCGFYKTILKINEILPEEAELNVSKLGNSNKLIEILIKGKDRRWKSNPVTNLFKSMGLWEHKGINKFIPEGGNKEFIRGIIEGLIETDGCISITGNTGNISFANISEKLVRGLQESLLRFGIHGSILVRKNNNSGYGQGKNYPLWYLSVKDSTSIIKFQKEFKLINKQEKLDILAEIKSKKIPKLQAKDKRRKHDTRFTFERVKSIEYIGVKNTYCVNLNDNLLVVEGLFPGNSILPSGAAVNATTVATGTPDIYVGWFYNTIQFNKKHDVSCTEENKLHFEADYSITEKYNPMYKKYVKKQMDRIGFDGDEFRMAYRLFWPITRGMLFVKDDLEKCYDKSLKLVQEYKETPCVAGLDLGKSIDSTVLTIIKPDWNDPDEYGNMPKQLLDWMEIVGDDWENQYDQIVEKLSNYWVDTLIVDATGFGDPISERLAILLPEVQVSPFVFTPSSKDRAYKYLLQEVKNSRLKIPANSQVRNTSNFKKFEQQMLTLKKTYSGKFLNPSSVDEKGHDDFPDALCLAVYATYFEVFPEILMEDNNFFKSNKVNTDFMGRDYSRIRG